MDNPYQIGRLFVNSFVCQIGRGRKTTENPKLPDMAKLGRPRNKPQLRRGPLYLTEWMEHLEVTDEELAGRLTVAANTVWRWRQTPQTRLNPVKQAQVAKALGIWPGQLWVKPGSREMRIISLMMEPEGT